MSTAIGTEQARKLVKRRKPLGKKIREECVVITIKRIDDPKVYERKSQGKTTKLGVYECIATLFEANEMLQANRKLTDEAITQFLISEFPNSKSVISMKSRYRGRTLNHYRSLYNLGKLTGAMPKLESHRWTIDGVKANLRTGRPLEARKRRKAAI